MCTYLNCAYIWSAQIQICIIWYSKWQGLWKFLNDVTIQQYITTSRVTYECVVMPNVHFNIYVAAYCIWSVLSLVSNLNPSSRSRSLVCHVLLKRDRWNGDWRLRLNDTPNAIDCTIHTICVCRKRCMCMSILSNRLMTIEIEWHSKCNRLYNTHK